MQCFDKHASMYSTAQLRRSADGQQVQQHRTQQHSPTGHMAVPGCLGSQQASRARPGRSSGGTAVPQLATADRGPGGNQPHLRAAVLQVASAHSRPRAPGHEAALGTSQQDS